MHRFVPGYVTNEGLVLAENNSQVQGRVEPRTTDLFSALKTGVIGSFALVRKDIAGTLPGVAIAISLVPPLCVCGICLSTKEVNHTVGAFLLFATNFAANVTGVVMLNYRIHFMVKTTSRSNCQRALAFVIMLALVAAVAFPLAVTSRRIGSGSDIEKFWKEKLAPWAESMGH